MSLSRSYAARRRVWRMVGVGMRLLRHYREVEGIVVEDDAVLVLSVRGRARYAQAHVPKRRSHHRVPRVLRLSAGYCVMRNLSVALARP